MYFIHLEAMKPRRDLGSTELTDRILAAAVRVHRELGPGFLESVYETALALEFESSNISYERQKTLPVLYRGKPVGEHRLDLLVEGAVIVELKAISSLEAVHFAIVRSYLKAAALNDALLLNFATPTLTVKRVGREYIPSRLKERVHL